ncbi:TetR/AcrR family transcriptional regulator [Nocardiopsis sp. NPDC050513]|uniref:TetR/AcrR family transcriptional regulator n=1 Tax=Nocardiopsis sp. NPDC050513 TaxID=3364338 RepID=UPI003789BE90
MATRTRGRPRGFDRDAALHQAMLLFWERGYDGIGISELTQTLGISATSLYAAFGDKRSLFEESVEAYTREHGSYIAEALEQEPTARGAVGRILGSAAERHTQPGLPAGCLLINGATHDTARSADVAAGLRRRRNEARRLIEARIRADRDAGVLPPTADPHALATHVVAVWHGMAQLARDGATRDDLLAAVEAAMRVWPAGGA